MWINICHLVQWTIPRGQIQYDGHCLNPFPFEDITAYLCLQHSRENLGTEVCMWKLCEQSRYISFDVLWDCWLFPTLFQSLTRTLLCTTLCDAMCASFVSVCVYVSDLMSLTKQNKLHHFPLNVLSRFATKLQQSPFVAKSLLQIVVFQYTIAYEGWKDIWGQCVTVRVTLKTLCQWKEVWVTTKVHWSKVN